MSASVISCEPALFIVPTTTFSPSSMLRRVMMPSNGASSVTCRRLYWLVDSCAALLADHLLAAEETPVSRACSSVSRTFSSLSARSSSSLVVSPCAHRSRWRLALSRASCKIRLGGLDVDAGLLQPCRGALDRRFTPLHRAAQRVGIDLEQELTRLDAVALFDGQLGDAAHLHRADVHEALRLDLARRRHQLRQVPLLQAPRR